MHYRNKEYNVERKIMFPSTNMQNTPNTSYNLLHPNSAASSEPPDKSEHPSPVPKTSSTFRRSEKSKPTHTDNSAALSLFPTIKNDKSEEMGRGRQQEEGGWFLFKDVRGLSFWRTVDVSTSPGSCEQNKAHHHE